MRYLLSAVLLAACTCQIKSQPAEAEESYSVRFGCVAEREAWVRYAAGSAGHIIDPSSNAEWADKFLLELRRRDPKICEVP